MAKSCGDNGVRMRFGGETSERTARDPWGIGAVGPCPPHVGEGSFGNESPEEAGPAPHAKGLGYKSAPLGSGAPRGGRTTRMMRSVEVQSQCIYKRWCKTPRFQPYYGSPGEMGFFTVDRLVHEPGTW